MKMNQTIFCLFNLSKLNFSEPKIAGSYILFVYQWLTLQVTFIDNRNLSLF